MKNLQDLESRFDHFDADSVTRYDGYLVLTHLNENAGNSKEDSVLSEHSRKGKNKSKENFELSGFHCRSTNRVSTVGNTHLAGLHSILYYPAFFHYEHYSFKAVLE